MDQTDQLPLTGSAQEAELLTSTDHSQALLSAAEREAVLNALLAASNYVLAGEDGEDSILRLADALIQSSSHIRLVWFWAGPVSQKIIEPRFAIGPDRNFATQLKIDRSQLLVKGQVFLLPVGSYTGSAIAVSLEIRNSNWQGMIGIYTDQTSYFERVGFTPFHALARFAEAALEHTRLRLQLQRAATLDPLSGLLNRRAISSALQSQIERMQEEQIPCSVALIDIDFFKRINDSYGHEVGDIAIAVLSETLRKTLRSEDLAARWGGEEFLLLLVDANLREAAIAAQRFRRAIEKAPIRDTVVSMLSQRSDYSHSIAHNLYHLKLTVSVGVASYPEDGNTMDKLLHTADIRLYRAKARGRNRVDFAPVDSLNRNNSSTKPEQSIAIPSADPALGLFNQTQGAGNNYENRE